MGAFGRWVLLTALCWPWFAAAGPASDGSKLPGMVRIDRKVDFPQAAPSRFYSHFAELNVYVTDQHAPSLSRIESELRQAQKHFDQCRIYLRLRSVNHLAAPPLLAQWESIEFSMGLTPWERALFILAPTYSGGIVYVESLDWTIGRNGITAIGYAPFIETETDYLKGDAEKAFYRAHIAGHAVLGRSTGRWTLTHELGHAIMNLRHVGDRGNIMFGGQLAREDAPRFTEAQCSHGRANAPWVKRLERGPADGAVATADGRWQMGLMP